MNRSKKSVVSSGFFFLRSRVKVFNLSSLVTVLVLGSKPKKLSKLLLMLLKSIWDASAPVADAVVFRREVFGAAPAEDFFWRADFADSASSFLS